MEPNHATARKSGPPKMVQCSLVGNHTVGLLHSVWNQIQRSLDKTTCLFRIVYERTVLGCGIYSQFTYSHHNLKVVCNEKGGGSGRWHTVTIGSDRGDRGLFVF